MSEKISLFGLILRILTLGKRTQQGNPDGSTAASTGQYFGECIAGSRKNSISAQYIFLHSPEYSEIELDAKTNTDNYPTISSEQIFINWLSLINFSNINEDDNKHYKLKFRFIHGKIPPMR